MRKLFTILVTSLMMVFVSCEKDYNEFYSDNHPDVPVTYQEATSHGFNPYIEVPLSTGNFTLTLTIPENSGRSIKEIRKVLGGSTSINAGGLSAANFVNYISNPIAGNGRTAVFSSSISEFRSKNAANEKLVADFEASSSSRLEIAFMFQVILDNDQTVIPVQARVWINK